MKTKTLYLIIGAWLFFLLVMMLTGCKTKSVTEYVSVHDTTFSAIRDTVTKIVTKTVTKTDSASGYRFHGLTEKILKTRDRTVTLNERGDTTRVDTQTATHHYLHEKDSTSYYRERCDSLAHVSETYKSRCDSLQSVIDREREKQTVKGATWWERIKVFGTGVVVIAIVLTICWWLRRR